MALSGAFSCVMLLGAIVLLRMALTICRFNHDGSLRTPGARVLFIRS
jgi:hypothetical protein